MTATYRRVLRNHVLQLLREPHTIDEVCRHLGWLPAGEVTEAVLRGVRHELVEVVDQGPDKDRLFRTVEGVAVPPPAKRTRPEFTPEAILGFLREAGEEGCRRSEVRDHFGELDRDVRRELGALRRAGLVTTVGSGRGSRWLVVDLANNEISEPASADDPARVEVSEPVGVDEPVNTEVLADSAPKSTDEAQDAPEGGQECPPAEASTAQDHVSAEEIGRPTGAEVREEVVADEVCASPAEEPEQPVNAEVIPLSVLKRHDGVTILYSDQTWRHFAGVEVLEVTG